MIVFWPQRCENCRAKKTPTPGGTVRRVSASWWLGTTTSVYDLHIPVYENRKWTSKLLNISFKFDAKPGGWGRGYFTKFSEGGSVHDNRNGLNRIEDFVKMTGQKYLRPMKKGVNCIKIKMKNDSKWFNTVKWFIFVKSYIKFSFKYVLN